MPEQYQPVDGDPFAASAVSLQPVFGDPFTAGAVTPESQGQAQSFVNDFANKASQTWPVRMAQGAYTAAMAPGEYMQGKISDEEAQHQAFNLAGLAMTGGVISGVERGAGEAVLGSGPIRQTVPSLPLSEAELNPNAMVNLGQVHRGTEGTATAETGLRYFKGGDIGDGIYATQNKDLAGSYGGGPKASLAAGTRVVHTYDTQPLYPEDVAYTFGGTKVGEPTRLVAGNGIPLWEGEWSPSNIESALQQHEGIKAVVGTPGSIGINQIAIRDKSILKPASTQIPVTGDPFTVGQPLPLN